LYVQGQGVSALTLPVQGKGIFSASAKARSAAWGVYNEYSERRIHMRMTPKYV